LKYRAKTFSNWINERVEYHRELSTKFWSNDEMDPEIREKLLAIADDFWKSLKFEVPILDIQLTGSLANFNWNSDSDLDVHIIIDFSKIDPNIELVRKALDGQRFIWNQRHNVVLRGHDVECYVQHRDEQHIASGLYSILNNRWIIVPEWTNPKIDQKDINEKKRVIKAELKMIKQEITKATAEKAEMLYLYLDKFKKKIMTGRKEGLARDGEFSVENLVFKELRRDGTIEDIIETQSKLYSLIYSE